MDDDPLFVEAFKVALRADCGKVKTLQAPFFRYSDRPKRFIEAIEIVDELDTWGDGFMKSFRHPKYRRFETPRSRQILHVCPVCGSSDCADAKPAVLVASGK